MEDDAGKLFRAHNWEALESVQWNLLLEELNKVIQLWTNQCENCRDNDSDNHGAKKNQRARERFEMDMQRAQIKAETRGKGHPLKKVSNAIKNGEACKRPIILVEGFLLFSHPVCSGLFDKQIFLTIPRETCRKRR